MTKLRLLTGPVILLVIFITLSFASKAYSGNGFPRNELPFCPGGGPPGWLNYLDHRRDPNILRRYPQYQPPGYKSNRYRAKRHNSNSRERNSFRPGYYSPQHYYR